MSPEDDPDESDWDSESASEPSDEALPPNSPLLESEFEPSSTSDEAESDLDLDEITTV